MPTIREVAAAAGVSPATVSRVVNGVGGYGRDTRTRVVAAIKELGYEPDGFARGLKTQEAALIGLLAPQVSDALASLVMQGVEDEARVRGHAVMLGRTGAGSAYIEHYLRTLRSYRAAGVILVSAVVTPALRSALGTSRPVISVAISDQSGSPSVSIDDERAAYDGTRHLISLGHRHIGLMAGDRSSVHVGERRVAGYLRAMAAAGLEPNIVHGSFFYDSGAPALRQLQANDPRMTAVFALSDEMAAAAVNELQRQGRTVPDDCSILGFDDTATARHVEPALSTVAQPLEEMGRMAVAKLLRARDLAPKVVSHRIVTRGSTAPPSSTQFTPSPTPPPTRREP